MMSKGTSRVVDAVAMTEEERAAAEKAQRSFERSFAGPSVGKAGAYYGKSQG